MKKKLSIIAVVMLLILSICVNVQADSKATITIKVSNENIKVGDTFTVTLSATCDEGINGIDTTYTYDVEKLELVSANVSDANKWVSLGTDNAITVISNTSSKITNSEIYVLTFKIKENVKEGDKIEIATTKTMLDSDAATNSQYTIDEGKVEITVATETTGDGGQSTSTGDKPIQKDPTTENPKGEENQPSKDSGNTEENTFLVKTSSDNAAQEKTKANQVLPYAGVGISIIIAAVAVLGISILIYMQYRKLKDIK